MTAQLATPPKYPLDKPTPTPPDDRLHTDYQRQTDMALKRGLAISVPNEAAFSVTASLGNVSDINSTMLVATMLSKSAFAALERLATIYGNSTLSPIGKAQQAEAALTPLYSDIDKAKARADSGAQLVERLRRTPAIKPDANASVRDSEIRAALKALGATERVGQVRTIIDASAASALSNEDAETLAAIVNAPAILRAQLIPDAYASMLDEMRKALDPWRFAELEWAEFALSLASNAIKSAHEWADSRRSAAGAPRTFATAGNAGY